MLASHPWKEVYSHHLLLVRECANRFETLLEMSPICEKATPVLRYLL
jgi:hypothetical protein